VVDLSDLHLGATNGLVTVELVFEKVLEARLVKQLQRRLLVQLTQVFESHSYMLQLVVVWFLSGP